MLTGSLPAQTVQRAPRVGRYCSNADWHCYPYTGNGVYSWWLSSSPSLSVGFSIQDEAMNAEDNNANLLSVQPHYYHVG